MAQAQQLDGRFKADPIAVMETVTNNPLLTREEVGKIHGITPSRVSQLCTKYGYNREELEDYKDNRADIFANIGKVITESLTPDEIKKAPAASRVLMLCQIYDKERLERGQATEISVNFDAVKAIDTRRREIEARIKAIESGIEDRPQDVVLEAEISTPIMLEDATNTVQHSDMTGDTTDSAKLTDYTLSDVGPRQATRRGRPRKGR